MNYLDNRLPSTHAGGSGPRWQTNAVAELARAFLACHACESSTVYYVHGCLAGPTDSDVPSRVALPMLSGLRAPCASSSLASALGRPVVVRALFRCCSLPEASAPGPAPPISVARLRVKSFYRCFFGDFHSSALLRPVCLFLSVREKRAKQHLACPDSSPCSAHTTARACSSPPTPNPV